MLFAIVIGLKKKELSSKIVFPSFGRFWTSKTYFSRAVNTAVNTAVFTGGVQNCQPCKLVRSHLIVGSLLALYPSRPCSGTVHLYAWPSPYLFWYVSGISGACILHCGTSNYPRSILPSSNGGHLAVDSKSFCGTTPTPDHYITVLWY